jgi:hypothetical protein
LSVYKQSFGITPVVLPFETRERLAEELRSAEEVPDQTADNVETHDDMFAFDISEEPAPPANTSTSSSSFINDDPFNFDDDSFQGGTAQQTREEEDVFSDLLESTSQSNADPFALPLAPTKPEISKPAAAPSSPGEFDLDSFSWDDTPVDTVKSAADNAPDDFDSLFGDAAENSKK